MARPKHLIVDLRSQLTNNIQRAAREEGFRTATLEPEKARRWIDAGNDVESIILSGGDFSVTDAGAPQPPDNVWTARRPDGRPVPILAICYGHQLFAHKFGGLIGRAPEHSTDVCIELVEPESLLFMGTSPEQRVVMNHGDSVVRLPQGFRELARSRDGGINAAMADETGRYWSVQFHPEATQTEFGKMILHNFFSRICGSTPDWSPSTIIDTIRGEVLEAAAGGNVHKGFSGGVDSTTLAAILAPVFGDRLLGLTVDADHLRENELAEVALHAEAAGLRHEVIDASNRVERFAGVIDAQKKRKLFQRAVYVPYQRLRGQEHHSRLYLQGSLAPDLIESGETGGALIKSHHNVGLKMGVPQLHPLRDLFKYEVRALARQLGLPESVWARQPFPGPGLFIRIIGTPVTHELLACVRWADARVREVLQQDPALWEHISQLVVAYSGLNTVGQKGDGRVYTGSIMVRAVHTLDFMTAEGIEFDIPVQRAIKKAMTLHPEHSRQIVHTMFVPTDKPPGTTEFE
ncbi:MAG: gamma-glutamyl-gamma-aminobutyrate hydrolase family protein [Patescibacteria group bacterium]